MGKLCNFFFKVLLISVLLVVNKSFAQEKSIFGKVIDPQTNKPISGINIINKQSQQIVATNDTGDFFIRANAGDSILITTFGYIRKGFVFDGVNKYPVINTKQQAILLQELVVKDKRLAELHKEIEDFLANPNDSKAIRNELLKSMISSNITNPGQGLGVSIDALYDMFSKSGKSKQRLADLTYTDARKFYANLRYNKQVVLQVTHLPDDDLDDFMKFCTPTEDFILRSTDYDLTHKILVCLGDFKKYRFYKQLR